MSVSSLKQRLTDDMKAAMRAKNKERLKTIRLILAALQQQEVDTRSLLGDADIIGILDKMTKQRRESIRLFEEAGRNDLVLQEQNELRIIHTYLPQSLTDREITQLIEEAFSATDAHSIRDMGKVMAYVRPKAQGRVDMAVLSGQIKQRLLA